MKWKAKRQRKQQQDSLSEQSGYQWQVALKAEIASNGGAEEELGRKAACSKAVPMGINNPHKLPVLRPELTKHIVVKQVKTVIQ